MNRRAGLLFPAALGMSAAAHLLLLFLLPYSPARPSERPPEPIAVRLLAVPRPAPRPASAPRRQTVRPKPEPLAPEQVPAPVPQPEPVPPPPAESPLTLAPPEPAPATAPQESTGPEVASGSPSESGAEATGAITAEIAATQAVLASLRARIIEKIRYPALARANGWKGTVLLELLLDERGLLQGLAVRRSSGYTVLDRAAAALMRSVSPVENPLGRPLRIEVPITYELTD